METRPSTSSTRGKREMRRGACLVERCGDWLVSGYSQALGPPATLDWNSEANAYWDPEAWGGWAVSSVMGEQEPVAQLPLVGQVFALVSTLTSKIRLHAVQLNIYALRGRRPSPSQFSRELVNSEKDDSGSGGTCARTANPANVVDTNALIH